VYQERSFKLQHLTTAQAEEIRIKSIKCLLPLADLVRFHACSDKAASAWLFAFFNDPDALDHTMSDSDVTYALRHRVGMPVAFGITKCGLCGCALTCDAVSATHPQWCTAMKRKETTQRHDGGVSLIRKQCLNASVPAKSEVAPDRQQARQRPDGLQQFSDCSTMSDNAVVHPATPTLLNTGNVARCLATLGTMAKSKTEKYAALALSEGRRFYALILDSYGRMHKEYKAFLCRIADAAAEAHLITQDEVPAYRRGLLVATSVALQRGNALMYVAFARRAVCRT
jgi:hypothetical protein